MLEVSGGPAEAAAALQGWEGQEKAVPGVPGHVSGTLVFVCA